ncbi:MAG: hypothetical protein IJ106_06345 [Parasporobacterium sp.]|nr:hypothetical protein [Parasporobacterium sp.]
MEYVFSIMMFCMAGGLLLYAGLLALLRDPLLIPRHYAAKMGNRKVYCLMIAKIVAVVSLPFTASGITGLIWNSDVTLVPAIIVFIIAMVACIYWARRIVKKNR